jgi:hypothetical protein
MKVFRSALLLTLMAVSATVATSLLTSTAIAASNNVIYHNGHLISNAKIVNMLWSVDWNSHVQNLTEATIEAATESIINSGYMSGLSQYGAQRVSFGGTWQALHNRVNCPQRNPPATVNTAELDAYIYCNWANTSAGFPSPNANTIYALYVPQGTGIAGNSACTNYLGYHSYLPFPTSGGFAYFIVLPMKCIATVASLTDVLSHEIAEAMTDPLVGAGWYEGSGIQGLFGNDNEVADICDSNNVPPYTLNWVTVNAYWSNRDGSCTAGAAGALTVTSLSITAPKFVGTTATASVTVQNNRPSTFVGRVALHGTSAENGGASIPAVSFPTTARVSIPAGGLYTYTASLDFAGLEAGSYQYWMSIVHVKKLNPLQPDMTIYTSIPGAGTEAGGSCGWTTSRFFTHLGCAQTTLPS